MSDPAPSISGIALIEAMAAYVSSGVAEELLAGPEAAVGRARLRLICIGLLSWLNSRSRVHSMNSMRTKEVGSAADSLVRLLESDPSFAAAFALQGDIVGFHPGMSQQDVDKITAAAATLYDPPRFVTPKAKGKDQA